MSHPAAASFEERFAEIHPPLGAREALAEAQRCLFCFDAPCAGACPTHIDVPGFIKRIASGNLGGSARTILDANVLGLSCARVCPVDVLCEGACVMHRSSQRPIEIGRLQRHAMDYFHDRRGRLPAPAAGKPGRVACIGAGPASLACAAELRQRGHRVTIFDRRELAGGLNTYGVAEYKFRPADSRREIELIEALGVEFRLGVEVGAACSIEDIEREFDIIFVAVGLGPTRRLGIPGENLPGVVDALGFIADYKIHGGTRVGRRVIVIGGGNTSIDAATAARRLGAEEVRILYRRGESEMPAFRFEYEIAKQDGIRFHWYTQPVAIGGAGAVGWVECMAVDPGPVRASEMRLVEDSRFRLDCDMVIPAIGQTRLVEFLASCRGLELADGGVVADPRTGQTANPRYFAGGDCVNGGREVVDAVAEGKRAARAIAGRLDLQPTADSHG